MKIYHNITNFRKLRTERMEILYFCSTIKVDTAVNKNCRSIKQSAKEQANRGINDMCASA